MTIYTLISRIMKSARNVSTMIYAPFFQFNLLRVKLVWDLGEPLSTYAPFFQFKLLRVKACFGPWQSNVDLRAVLPNQASRA